MSRVSISLIVAGFCLLASGAEAATATSPTEVEGVVIVADTDVRLSIAVGGDISENTFVASAPPGLACGGAHYQFLTRESRQCWLRVRRKTPVYLTAQNDGRYGVDWTVQWVGCEPVGNGAACTLNAQDEAQVVALFMRKTAP